MCEICQNWARTGEKMTCGKMIPTNHHPNCPHYNDSLIDVYKATFNGKSCYAKNEKELREIIGDIPIGLVLEGVEMHKEIFDNLPEFEGF